MSTLRSPFEPTEVPSRGKVSTMSEPPRRTVADGLRDIKDLAADLTRELERVHVDLTTGAYRMAVRIRDQATELLADLGEGASKE
jgi:hypothetical protein